MKTSQRMMLTILLCALIIGVQMYFSPTPPPVESSESQPVSDSQDAASPPAEVRPEPSTTTVEANPAAQPANDEQAAEPVPAQALRQHTIENQFLRVHLSNDAQGILNKVEILDPQFRDDNDQPKDLLELAPGHHSLKPYFDPEASDIHYPKVAGAVLAADTTHWQIRRDQGPLQVEESFELLGNYYAHYQIKLHNLGQSTQRYALRLKQAMHLPPDENRYDLHRGLCYNTDDLVELEADDLDDGPVRLQGEVTWGGLDSKYFLSAIAPSEPGVACSVDSVPAEQIMRFELMHTAQSIGPHEQKVHDHYLYLGPKTQDSLRAFSEQLPPSAASRVDLNEAIDWGWLGGMSRAFGGLLLYMLRLLHSWTGVWGLAIILVTLIVRIGTLPLTLKQFSSMKKMREIQPEMARIKEQYANDKAKQAMEMQALMARSGANPLAGCVPMLVQLPIWFAFFATLGVAVEFYREPFLWLPDLTKSDPYFILPVAIGVLMWLQMRMQPSGAMDSQQAKMMQRIMPGFYCVMTLFLPAGLGVYIFTSSLLSFVQSMIQLKPWASKDPVVVDVVPSE